MTQDELDKRQEFIARTLTVLTPLLKEYKYILNDRVLIDLVHTAVVRYMAVGKPYKYCPVCKYTKERDAFGSDMSRYDQLTSVCRECRKK